MQQFDVVKGKSATDMKMTIDAMDLLYRGNVDHFGIMSSDSDFLPLAQRIREDGLQVYGFGTAKTPLSFQQACSRFFDVGALALADDESSTSRLPRRASGRSIPSCSRCSARPTRPRSATRKAMRSLSELGQRAKAVSSFAARNYGFTRLSDLIKAVPNFEVKAGDDGRIMVKRLR